MARPRSVIICGGGIIGLCTAYSLAREGFRVTLLERNAAGADSCAQGSAGCVSPSHVAPISAPGMVLKGLKWMLSSRSPFYIKPRLDTELMRWGWLFARACTGKHLRRSAPVLRDLCLGGRELFVELADVTGNAFELKTEGLLNLCKTPEGLDHEAHGLAALANEVGVEARVLDAKQTAALEPGIKMEVAGSVYFPIDAHLTPRKFMPTLLALLKEMGVKFLWSTSVYGWRSEGGRIAGVQTTAGDLVADDYVLSGGSWSPSMVAGLNIRIPMQAGKGYSLTIEQPRFHLTKSLILTERRVAVTPMGNQLRFGGTMEIAGHNDSVRPERIEQIIAAAPHYFPEVTPQDFAGIKPWFGYRPVTPDGLPYIGRFRRHQNLVAACGHAMLGITMAPITGKLVGEVLTGKKPSVDLAMLNPDRYA
ncbi:MAG TPA: FAD-dependent oxidoreductase [Candidatus Didemnitutus sp.]|nr:FAD-dependent oxidoreductase [Candidatus Didemnitutus sp.]